MWLVFRALLAGEPISEGSAHIVAILSVPSLEALESGGLSIAWPPVDEIELSILALRAVVRDHEWMERDPIFFCHFDVKIVLDDRTRISRLLLHETRVVTNAQ